MISSDFRAEARKRLEGKWGKVACISLAYMASLFVLGFIGGLIPEKSLFNSIFSLATTIIEIPLAFGLIIAFFKLYRYEDVTTFEFLDLGFSNFKKAWGITFRIFLKLIVPSFLLAFSIGLIIFSGTFSLVSLLVGSSSGLSTFGAFYWIGCILAIVSLIWLIFKSYYFQLAQIVAIDNPNLTSKEAVLKSKELMQNNRWKLFCLQLSIIGWIIILFIISEFIIVFLLLNPFLSLISSIILAISMIWILPYMQFATFAFYDYINGNSNQVEIITNNEENNNPISEK